MQDKIADKIIEISRDSSYPSYWSNSAIIHEKLTKIYDLVLPFMSEKKQKELSNILRINIK